MNDYQDAPGKQSGAGFDRQDFPDPPWRLGGQQWAGLFRTERPVQATAAESLGGKPMLSHRLGIALLRYTTGPLVYDELLVSIPIWIGWKPVLWIRDIWVSNPQSQAGGIQIWNLPKQLATFRWEHDTVTVEDAHGLIAKLQLRPATTHWPWAISMVPIAGLHDGHWRTATSIWRGRVSLAKPRVQAWSSRFAERLVDSRTLGFSSSQFTMSVRGGRQV